jgi:hypothetical protein
MSLVTLVESGQAVESDEANISGEAAGCVQPLNSPGSKGTARAEREDRELRDLACLRQPQREGHHPLCVRCEESDGLVVAMKRGNARGAKEP